jgi:hypothetical protein
MFSKGKGSGAIAEIKRLLVLSLALVFLLFSTTAFTQRDTVRRPPPPPPHPKLKSIKEVWTKINPFKKKNADNTSSKADDHTEAVKPPPPLPAPVTPPPAPKPTPAVTTHKKKTVTKKKVKKPATDKPVQPLI